MRAGRDALAGEEDVGAYDTLYKVHTRSSATCARRAVTRASYSTPRALPRPRRVFPTPLYQRPRAAQPVVSQHHGARAFRNRQAEARHSGQPHALRRRMGARKMVDAWPSAATLRRPRVVYAQRLRRRQRALPAALCLRGGRVVAAHPAETRDAAARRRPSRRRAVGQ